MAQEREAAGRGRGPRPQPQGRGGSGQQREWRRDPGWAAELATTVSGEVRCWQGPLQGGPCRAGMAQSLPAWGSSSPVTLSYSQQLSFYGSGSERWKLAGCCAGDRSKWRCREQQESAATTPSLARAVLNPPIWGGQPGPAHSETPLLAEGLAMLRAPALRSGGPLGVQGGSGAAHGLAGGPVGRRGGGSRPASAPRWAPSCSWLVLLVLLTLLTARATGGWTLAFASSRTLQMAVRLALLPPQRLPRGHGPEAARHLPALLAPSPLSRPQDRVGDLWPPRSLEGSGNPPPLQAPALQALPPTTDTTQSALPAPCPVRLLHQLTPAHAPTAPTHQTPWLLVPAHLGCRGIFDRTESPQGTNQVGPVHSASPEQARGLAQLVSKSMPRLDRAGRCRRTTHSHPCTLAHTHTHKLAHSQEDAMLRGSGGHVQGTKLTVSCHCAGSWEGFLEAVTLDSVRFRQHVKPC